MLKAYIPDYNLTVDVAVTGSEIATGLSDRTSMSEREGMLFICCHDRSPLPFWMKNMQIPLDIIWLDDTKMVISVLHNAVPCPIFGDCPSYMPDKEFSYVLETVAGFAEKYNITPGTRINFNIDS